MSKETSNLPSTYVRQNEDDIPTTHSILMRQAVRFFLLFCKTEAEADKEIQKWNPQLQGEETVEVLQKKYDYLKELYPNIGDPISSNKNETRRDKLFGDYYSGLSLVRQGLIMYKPQNLPQKRSPIQADFVVE